MTNEEMRQEIERLKAQLSESRTKRLSLKVSSKGGVSVYGLGRFPVSLYESQWERLLEFAPEIKAFLAENRDKLASKLPTSGEQAEAGA